MFSEPHQHVDVGVNKCVYICVTQVSLHSMCVIDIFILMRVSGSALNHRNKRKYSIKISVVNQCFALRVRVDVFEI